MRNREGIMIKLCKVALLAAIYTFAVVVIALSVANQRKLPIKPDTYDYLGRACYEIVSEYGQVILVGGDSTKNNYTPCIIEDCGTGKGFGCGFGA
jgi:hypothetical protein